MFTFSDTPVTFTVLLLLFALCTAWCSYESSRPQNGRQRVSSVLHLAMAVVMLLMVTGPTWALLTAVLPAGWLAAGFAAATLWFGFLTFDALARRNQAGGWHGAGHAAMFAAMTWHLAAMAVMGGMDHSGMGASHMNGGGADMPTWIAEQSLPGGTLWIFALIGLPLMAYLLIASLHSLWEVARPATLAPEHPREPAGRRDPDCTSADQHVAGEDHSREAPDGGTVALATSPTDDTAARLPSGASSGEEHIPAGRAVGLCDDLRHVLDEHRAAAADPAASRRTFLLGSRPIAGSRAPSPAGVQHLAICTRSRVPPAPAPPWNG